MNTNYHVGFYQSQKQQHNKKKQSRFYCLLTKSIVTIKIVLYISLYFDTLLLHFTMTTRVDINKLKIHKCLKPISFYNTTQLLFLY